MLHLDKEFAENGDYNLIVGGKEFHLDTNDLVNMKDIINTNLPYEGSRYDIAINSYAESITETFGKTDKQNILSIIDRELDESYKFNLNDLEYDTLIDHLGSIEIDKNQPFIVGQEILLGSINYNPSSELTFFTEPALAKVIDVTNLGDNLYDSSVKYQDQNGRTISLVYKDGEQVNNLEVVVGGNGKEVLDLMADRLDLLKERVKADLLKEKEVLSVVKDNYQPTSLAAHLLLKVREPEELKEREVDSFDIGM